jgi:hypothetical protein
MSKPSLQLSVTGLVLSAIVQALGMQALGAAETPLGVGQDMRNIGKGLEPGVGRRGRAALIDVKAEQTQPKSHISTDIEACSGRTDGVAAIRSSDSVSGREADTASRGRRNRYRRRQPLKLKRGRVAGCSNPTATAYRPGVLELDEVVTREGSPWIAKDPRLGAPSPNHLLAS